MSAQMDMEYIAEDEISQASVERCTASSLPLILPWHPKETIQLGTLFHSQRPHDPWAKNSPFSSHSLRSTPKILSRDDGTESSFKSLSTTRTSESQDHLSLGLTLGVGLPFLAEVSVTGNYDKDVLQNADACKTSIRSSVRAGSVTFARQPRLSAESIITLKYDGGLPAFKARYGDYYVAGYRLGGDTALMISGSSAAKKELEKFSITVKVEVLFFEASTTHSEYRASATASSSLRMVGYDTLEHRTWKAADVEGKSAGAASFRAQAAEVMVRSQSLDIRVMEKLNELGFQDEEHLSKEDCDELTKSGLVAELVLLPVSTLREVIEWVIEDDII